MLHTILGAEAFRRGCDIYFERHDGHAATTDDFLMAMVAASGRDLEVFRRWYSQAGTPVLDVSSRWQDGALFLTLQQSCPATPGQPEKLPLHMPVALGLIAADGKPIAPQSLTLTTSCDYDIRGDTIVVELMTPAAELVIRGVSAEPAISLLRGFSAPVRINYPRHPDTLQFLARHDSDGFAAWDALQTLLVNEVSGYAEAGQISARVVQLFGMLLQQALDACADGSDEDRFMLAAKLTIPQESYLFEQFATVDVDAICAARDALQQALARAHEKLWLALYQASSVTDPYQPDAAGMSRRALCNLALGFVAQTLQGDALAQLLEGHYLRADNLTDRRAALVAAVNSAELDPAVSARLLEQFLQRFRAQALVVNQWFAVQAGSQLCRAPDIQALSAHAAFDLKNPNKVRSLFSAFMQTNLRNFHALDGSGYQLIADTVLALNPVNPQVASALAKPLTRWRRFAGVRPGLMRQALERLAKAENLSPDVFEVVAKGLAD
jgi:aminopeptidase N